VERYIVYALTATPFDAGCKAALSAGGPDRDLPRPVNEIAKYLFPVVCPMKALWHFRELRKPY